MSNAPVFAFDNTEIKGISNEEAKKLLTSERLPVREFFKAVVLKVEYKGTLAKDNGWHKFAFTFAKPGSVLGSDDKAYTKEGKKAGSSKHTVCLPGTNNIAYAGDLSSGARMTSNYLDFLKAFGIEADFETHGQATAKHFSNPAGFVGKECQIILEYKGDYVGYENEAFVILDKHGKPQPKFVEVSFESRDDAVAAYIEATEGAFDIASSYANITKFKPVESTQAKAVNTAATQSVEAQAEGVKAVKAVVEDSEY